MHDDAHELIVMVEIGISEVYLGAVHDWLEVTHVCAFKCTVDIEIKIMEFKFNVTAFRHHPGIDFLFGLHFPFFENWEINFHHWFGEGADKVEFNICEIEFPFIVYNVFPLNSPC